MDKMYGFENQKVEIGMVLPTITTNDKLGEYVFPVASILDHVGLEVLLSEE
jgi:hypothetical protein